MTLEEGAVDAAAVKVLVTRARRDIEEGLLPSCQLALALDGEVVLDETLGAASDSTRYVVFSCSKALVAATVWSLMGEGAVDVDLPVVEYIPEFATNDKDAVTVEQLLIHTAGFPNAPMHPLKGATSEGRTKAFAEWRLNYEPGTAFVYHPTSAHWVLAEIIERVGGGDYRQVIHDRVTDPLGLPKALGAPLADQDGVAEIQVWGEPPTPDEIEAMLGVRSLPNTEVTNAALSGFNDPAWRVAGVPGGGGIMRAADLALLYQGLLHNPGELWRDDILADGTGKVRNHFPDPVFRISASRTLGLVLAGDDGMASFRGFGNTVSANAFGHGGAAGQIAWADPDSGLSFAYVTNGIDDHVIRQFFRRVELSSLAGAAVGSS